MDIIIYYLPLDTREHAREYIKDAKEDEIIDEIFKLDEKLRKKNVQVFIEVNAQDLR